MTVLVAFVAAVLFACGSFLLLQRRLSRIIIGVGLLGHGANLLLLVSGGGAGPAPIVPEGANPADYADPLPQALALTAIVITFGVTAFLLAMAYRSWQLSHDDVVPDDVEDRLVAAHRFEDSDEIDAATADLEHTADSADGDDRGMDGGDEWTS